jgi:hypothetical protein
MGIKKRTCTRCSSYETENISATGHTSNGTLTTIKEATCTETGTKVIKCSKCGEALSPTTIPALGHSYGSWTIIKDAACTTMGIRKRTCTRCSSYETENIPATGHTSNGTLTTIKDATCTETGTKGIKCSKCGEVLSPTTIPALGHSYGSWTIIKAATCTAMGVKKRTCTRCPSYETENIPVTGHTSNGTLTTVKDATCTETGTRVIKCSACGEVLSTVPTPIDPNNHSYGLWEKFQQGNCGKDEIQERKCTRSGCYYSEKDITKTATGLHVFNGSYVVTKEPTYTEEGTREARCSVCGKLIQTVVIPALGSYDSQGTGKIVLYKDGKFVVIDISNQSEIVIKIVDGWSNIPPLGILVYKDGQYAIVNSSEVGSYLSTGWSTDPLTANQGTGNITEKSNCDMEFFMPDPNKVSTFMRNSIDYLLEKVIAGKADWCTFNGTESVWCTPEDFEDLLDTYLSWLQDPTISFIDSLVLRGEKIVDGTLQTIGGGTQTVAGYGIATIGSWGIVTVPLGIIVGADGLSNVWEGGEKVIKGLTTPLDSSYNSFNPIRDWAFKGVLGENAGTDAYNYFSLGIGIVGFAKSGVDIYNSGAVKSIVRTRQTGIAEKLNLPLKSKVVQWGDKIIVHTVDATSNSATPMITRKLIIDVKKLGNEGVYIGIDLRNSYCTINSINDN